MVLDEPGRRLLSYLVSRLSKAVPNDPSTFVSYKDVHEALGLPVQGTYGTSLKLQGLVSLAEWTKETNKPAITGLIIDRKKMEPGEGYFALFDHQVNPYGWWAGEIARSKRFDWLPYLESTEQVKPSLPMSPVDVASNAPSIWRLIAHHQHAEQALTWMIEKNVLAIGWSEIGDLDVRDPKDSAEIGRFIDAAFPDLSNANLGGPSLWNFWREMQIGDLVIVNGDGKKAVFEVVGEYFHASEADDVVGYKHRRGAVRTDIDGDDLWSEVGRRVAPKQNIRWTLARCSGESGARRAIYTEGARYEVKSTAIERNAAARQACIDHYGARCFACDFSFAVTYGDLGAGYIHVHHRSDISLSAGVYKIDPVRHLVPLCPNCHAMVHRKVPAMDVEKLAALIKGRR